MRERKEVNGIDIQKEVNGIDIQNNIMPPWVLLLKLLNPFRSSTCIRKTCPCNEYPIKPYFYIVKLGYAGKNLFFLFIVQNIDCGYSFV